MYCRDLYIYINYICMYTIFLYTTFTFYILNCIVCNIITTCINCIDCDLWVTCIDPLCVCHASSPHHLWRHRSSSMSHLYWPIVCVCHASSPHHLWRHRMSLMSHLYLPIVCVPRYSPPRLWRGSLRRGSVRAVGNHQSIPPLTIPQFIRCTICVEEGFGTIHL